MRVITWNVNSVRLRLPGVERLFESVSPDVLCLQEIKADETRFPFQALRDIGFEHIEMQGIPGYHGVATLSKTPIERLEIREWCGKQDGRHVGVRMEDGTEVHNFYVPAGGDEPDTETNEKFRHKMDFLAEMAEWGAARDQSTPAVLVGDLNVAPLETDVWSHKQLRNVVSHTQVEIDALSHAQHSGGWQDVVRAAISPDVPLFSWWSYRARDWAASNRGRRLDHIWATPPLAARMNAASVIKEARGWEKPSDHAPILATFQAE